jgi:hypothetical protein
MLPLELLLVTVPRFYSALIGGSQGRVPENAWIRDIACALSTEGIIQFLHRVDIYW